MFIVWGSRITRRSVGRIAAFCPICGEVKPFSLKRVGKVGHIYYISFGQGETVGYEGRCETCRAQVWVDPYEYEDTPKDRSLSLDALRSLALPSHAEHMRQLEERERLARRGEISEEDRFDRMLEPFLMVEKMVAPRTGETCFDKQSGLGCLFVVAVVFAAIGLATMVEKNDDLAGMIAVIGAIVAVAGALFTLVSLATDVGRFVRKRGVPLIVASLKPLAPRLEELERVIRYLKESRMVVGKKIKARKLYAAIQKATGRAIDEDGAPEQR
ncbi:MAG: hypothetical protein GC159_03335 [Phycisphaera sp.]|nr:hypothetical protein [Phycisphaera sp.]